MQERTLGSTGPAVSALGLGAMSMSGVYGETDRAESIATVHAALDAGVTLIDTGDFYGMGHNEMLLAEALRGRDRDSYQLSVKFGELRGPLPGPGTRDCRPEAVRNFLAYSLARLGTDHIDIYRPARLDPAVPIEETVGAIKELIEAGYVRHLGLSEVDAATIRRAHAVHPVADLQIEYSVLSRAVEPEILPTLRELGIGMTAYGVLGRGLLSGHWQAARRPPRATSARTARGSRRRTSRTTWPSWRPCGRSPRRRGARSPSSSSPGWPRGARTSCRWSARGPGNDWRRRCPRWRCGSPRTTSPRSRRRFRGAPRAATATRRGPCPPWAWGTERRTRGDGPAGPGRAAGQRTGKPKV